MAAELYGRLIMAVIIIRHPDPDRSFFRKILPVNDAERLAPERFRLHLLSVFEDLFDDGTCLGQRGLGFESDLGNRMRHRIKPLNPFIPGFHRRIGIAAIAMGQNPVTEQKELPGPADPGGIRRMDHLHAVLLFLDLEADLEAAVGPDLLIDDAAGFLGRKNHMHAEASADPGHRDQVPHKIRTVFFQLRKLIHDDDQCRKIRQFALRGPETLIRREIHNRLRYEIRHLLEQHFPPVTFVFKRDERAFHAGDIKIAENPCHMGDRIGGVGKQLGGTAALEVDHHKLQFPRAVIGRKRQQQRDDQLDF